MILATDSLNALFSNKILPIKLARDLGLAMVEKLPKLKNMHKKLLKITILLFIVSANFIQAQNVGINETGATPNGSAMLDVSATSKGMLIPRLSRAQKFLIPTPANGLMIYQTDDTAGFWYYEQSKWVPVMRAITFGPGLSGGFVQGKGNVDIVCEKHKIKQVLNIDELVEYIYEKI